MIATPRANRKIAFEAILQGFGIHQALDFSLDDVLQHSLIKTGIRDQLLELAILLFELFQVARFRDAHPRELLLPSIECLLRQTDFSSDIRHRRARFRLTKCKRDLLFGILFSLPDLEPPKNVALKKTNILSGSRNGVKVNSTAHYWPTWIRPSITQRG
jgi:hypothetical protein